jgi:hypothetical protein
VIKVMKSNREGGQFLWSARTKGCPKPFNWSIIKLYYIILPYQLSVQGRFKMEYRLFIIVRYNYRDYNKNLQTYQLSENTDLVITSNCEVRKE